MKNNKTPENFGNNNNIIFQEFIFCNKNKMFFAILMDENLVLFLGFFREQKYFWSSNIFCFGVKELAFRKTQEYRGIIIINLLLTYSNV